MTYNLKLSDPVKLIMTMEPISVSPNMLMTEVVNIFKNEEFHHVPVLDDNGQAIGIISESDVLQLQDKFTRFNCIGSGITNNKYFDSLLVSEVMTKQLVSIDVNATISELLTLFIEKKIRSVIINSGDKCVGIVTPFDILILMSNSVLQATN